MFKDMFKDKTTTIIVIVIAAAIAYYFLFMNKKEEAKEVAVAPVAPKSVTAPKPEPAPAATPDVSVKLQENVNPPIESAFGDNYFNQLFAKGYV